MNALEKALHAKNLFKDTFGGYSWFRGVLISLTDEGYYLSVHVDKHELRRTLRLRPEFVEFEGVPVRLEGV